MTWKIVRQDILKISADAIVLPAGPGHLPECAEEISSLHGKPMLAIYAKVPMYTDGNPEECKELESCYEHVLQTALERHCCRIALPVSAGSWPVKKSLRIARDILLRSEAEEDLEVLLSTGKDRSLLAEEFHEQAAEYILENRTQLKRVSRIFPNLGFPVGSNSMYRETAEESCCEDVCRPYASVPLEDYLAKASETFQEMLFRKIDESGLSDPQVYKRANIDRKLFSKIRSNPEYRPKKDTVIALCIALELDIDDTKDLMRRAEYAFSPSRKKDLIVEYCIEQELYDLMKINEILYDFHESSL